MVRAKKPNKSKTKSTPRAIESKKKKSALRANKKASKKVVSTPTEKSKNKPSTKKSLGRILPRKTPSTEGPTPVGSTLADDPTAKEILRRLRESLTPTYLAVSNLSFAHQKHASAKKHGGGHYSIAVTSDLFNGLSALQRQQWIHSLLEDLLKNRTIHALEMKLKNTDESSSI